METSIVAKIRNIVKLYWYDALVLGCVISIALISYNLGRIQALKKTPLEVVQGANIYTAAGTGDVGTGDQAANMPAVAKAAATPRDSRVVVSKASSSKKYHYTWCSGAKRIAVENQIWFDTATAAEQAGYTLAGNCQ